MVTVDKLMSKGFSQREARNYLTSLGRDENLNGKKTVVRVWSGEREKGGFIIAAGERNHAS